MNFVKCFISENKEFALEEQIKEEKEQDNPDSPNSRTSPPVSQNNEQGSTLRDLLTTTAGKLRVGSTDAGIAFAPVYSMGTPVSEIPGFGFHMGLKFRWFRDTDKIYQILGMLLFEL